MPIDWRPFIELVSSHSRFLITTHIRPDGDALGSEKALAAALRSLGKQVVIVNVSPLPSRYDFLDSDREVKTFHFNADYKDIEVIIVVDTGTKGQLEAMADFVCRHPAKKAVIDHHVTQEDLGATRFVDTTAEAAGRLVYQAINALGVKITQEIADPLFVAVATDTGWFRHGNVTPATFALAQELMHAGARPTFCYRQIFERITPGRLRLMGRIMSRLVVTDDRRIAYSALLQDDFAAAGATQAEGEDLTNYTVGLVGTPIGALFTELSDSQVKISFRATGDHEVGRAAERLGGGGHRQAAGATIQGSMKEAQQKVLEVLQSKGEG